jgi:hypothetical protein
MLCQLSCAVRSVLVCDISELSLVSSIGYHCNLVIMIFFCVGVMYSGEYDACDATLSVYPKPVLLAECISTVGSHRGQAYFSSLPDVDIHSE